MEAMPAAAGALGLVGHLLRTHRPADRRHGQMYAVRPGQKRLLSRELAVSDLKPCQPLPAPWVWWDTFSVPTGQQIDVTAKCTQSGQVKKDFCPANLQSPI